MVFIWISGIFNSALWAFRVYLLGRCLWLLLSGQPGPAFVFFALFALAALARV